MNKKNKIKIVVNGKLLTVNVKFSIKNLIEKLIFESLEQLVNETGIKLKISTPEDTPIFGSESKLDS